VSSVKKSGGGDVPFVMSHRMQFTRDYNYSETITTVNITVIPSFVNEGNTVSPSPFVFTITRISNDLVNQPLLVNLAVSGTATFTSDYTVIGAASFSVSSAGVVIPANSLSTTISITPIPDLVVEADETIILSIVSSGNVQSGINAVATAFILNDDAALSASTVLLHFDGTNGSTVFVDSSSSPKIVNASGTATLSTSQIKFGTASLRVTGTASSHAAIADTPAIELGSNDFTIEFWIYPITTANNYFLGKGDASSALGSSLSFSFSLGCAFYIGGATVNLPCSPPIINTWSHIAITRSGSTLRYFLNGLLLHSVAITGSVNNVNQPMQVGGYGPGGSNAHFDEFRLIVGTAIYTANFTPPVSAFVN
jgi:hypothetical protein